jgi:hypothetical protein
MNRLHFYGCAYGVMAVVFAIAGARDELPLILFAGNIAAFIAAEHVDLMERR